MISRSNLRRSAIRSHDRYRCSLQLEALEARQLLTVGDPVGSVANPNTGPQFGAETGWAVSVDGDLVAISAPGEDLSGFNNVGQVHIYDRQTESLVRSIPNPSPASGDRFGDAVAISGTTLVVGTQLDDATGLDSGQVTIFNALTGELLHIIDNPSPADFDYFGAAVDIEGDHVVVSARLDDTDGMDAGAAYVFDAQTGALVHTLVRPAPMPGDYFGNSVAIAGSQIAVGAPRTDSGSTDAGSVELYDAVTGLFDQAVNNPTPSSFEYFGDEVAISGTTLVVGTYSENTGAVNTGAAYIYDTTDGTLTHTLNNPAPALADNFGWSVAVDGDTVAIGAFRDNTGANDAGSVYQYSASTGLLQRTLNNPNPAAFDYFGADVAAFADVVVVGAYWDDDVVEDGGAAYFFDANTGMMGTTFFSPTASSFDFFGQAVAVSGNLMAVGTFLDDNGGVDAGSVQIFDTETGALLHSIPNPSPAARDNFGVSVAMSNDLLVVGAHRDDAGATDAGTAYLFDALSGTLLHTLDNPLPNDQDNFGISVAIDGTNVVVGADNDDTDALNTGAAYVFDAGSGLLLRTISNPTPDDFDRIRRRRRRGR